MWTIVGENTLYVLQFICKFRNFGFISLYTNFQWESLIEIVLNDLNYSGDSVGSTS